ncbi:MAG: peptidoglycan editing factor PgeF [Thermoanaerobacteraceae bacterium]|nr:peptidoglycan editing factor PgeF [Thermoanaerobacteraceae bacterium]
MNGTEVFQLNNIGDFEYFNIPAFDLAGNGNVITFFSTRNGGISEGIYSSLNLGIKKQDDIEKVEKNYEILCHKFNFNIDSLAFSDQIHKDNVLKVDCSHAGFPLHEQKIYDTDALITNERELPLVTYYADCVPLYFFDPVNEAIGLAHAGWRGTMMRIGPKVVNRMVEEFGTNPNELLVAIGPSIGLCCYEVGQEVYDLFLNEFKKYKNWFTVKNNGRYSLDLKTCNRFQLEDAGVNLHNIYISNFCTSCNEHHFYSYRRDKGKTGLHCAIIMLC